MTDASRPAFPGERVATAVGAAAAYVALVFALGFVLGAVRTLLVADESGSGRLAGVLVELPVMIAASWLACRFVVRRCRVAPALRSRLIMGGLAFALLLLAETLVGVLLFGRSPGEQLALYRHASYALGLAAQVAFAAMPVIQALLERGRRTAPTS